MRVGPADDRYEREADAAAAAVVERLASGGATPATAQRTPAATVRRRAGGMGAEGGAVADATAARIDARRGGGTAIPAAIRRSMEGAFGGADFGGVRLHTGAESASLNRELGASAFTVGSDIFLGGGTPSFGSAGGQRLLAHELAHTRQQDGAARRTIRRDRTDFSGLTGGRIGVTGSGDLTSEHEKANSAMEGAQGGTSTFGEFDSANSYRTDITKAGGRPESSTTGKWGNESSQNGITYTAGALSTFDLALDISKTVQMFMSGAKPEEKAGAVLGNLSSGAKTAAGMSSIAKTAQGAKEGSVTDQANSIVGEIAGILGVISSGYQLVKTIVDLIGNGKDMTDKEKAAKSLQAVKSALDAGKSVVETINKFMSHLGSLATGLVAAAPAIGIAINCIDMIMNGVNIGYAYVSWAEMRTDKNVFKDQATDYAGGKTFWGGRTSYKDTAKANVAAGDQVAKDLAAATGVLDTAKAKRTSTNDALQALKREVSALKGDLATEEAKKKPNARTVKRLKAQIATKEAEVTRARTTRNDAKTAQATAQTDFDAKQAAADRHETDHGATYRNSQEYLLSKNLQDIAGKRIQRGVLNVGLTLPAIAGDIAILSGAGAAVGGGLKAASGGGKLLAVGIRMGKQAYHNARGDSKSEANKLKMYEGMITGIIGHVNQAGAMPNRRRAEQAARSAAEAKAMREVVASGMAVSTMERYQSDGPKLYSEWVSALKAR